MLNKSDSEVQTEWTIYGPQVPVKHGKMPTEKVKTVIASLSTKCSLTAENAIKAFQLVSNEFFDQKYILSNEKGGDPRLSLPSKNTIRRQKHKLALKNEEQAAFTILNCPHGVKIVLYYDSTTRKGISGEWTSLIIIVGDEVFRLRPLQLGKETRDQIADFIIENLNRLAILGGTSAKVLWEKITALMTDSVSKNMEIEKIIAQKLESLHIPLHLICQSHFCESLDRGVEKCLVAIDEKIGLEETVLSRMPELKSYVSHKSVTKAALDAISSLVVDTGKPCNLYKEWLSHLATKSKKNKFVTYRENRFAQTGFLAASIIHHWDDLQELLGN